MHFNPSDIYLVVMAGGIGSRFWPMSTPEKPKQFQDVLGTGRTLLQETVERFSEIVPAENILVVTAEKYAVFVRQQVPSIPEQNILREPVARNTAPCVAYAAFTIHQRNPEGIMVVTPADHFVARVPEFRETLKHSLQWLGSHRDSLLTIGISPNRPETGYGYIELHKEEDRDIHPVSSFREKPDAATAAEYLKSGNYLWNSGIFLWYAGTIIDAFKRHMPPVYELFRELEDGELTVQETYDRSPSISIDFGIMEKSESIHVIPASCGWSDLGTWGALWEMQEHDSEGNSKTKENIQLYSTKNSVIRIPDNKKAIVQGLNGFIVVMDEDHLLIFPKEDEQLIGTYSKKFNSK